MTAVWMLAVLAPQPSTPSNPRAVAPPPVAVRDTAAHDSDDTDDSDDTERVLFAQGEHRGPPFYDTHDIEALRRRHGLRPATRPTPRVARWRCLIADPTCRMTFEINATSAYAYRLRQGDVRTNQSQRWHSGRVQYDGWLNVPVLEEIEGGIRYTKMTMGPKVGAIFSDTGDIWGNIGMAFRVWLGRGRWAPTFELTGALTFQLASRPQRDLGGANPKFQLTRSPVGFAADVGFGIGGFGAIIVGGQYDSPLAREDVPDRYRVAASGMFFLGWRGNIAWGGPAATAVLTHGLTQRYANPGR